MCSCTLGFQRLNHDTPQHGRLLSQSEDAVPSQHSQEQHQLHNLSISTCSFCNNSSCLAQLSHLFTYSLVHSSFLSHAPPASQSRQPRNCRRACLWLAKRPPWTRFSADRRLRCGINHSRFRRTFSTTRRNPGQLAPRPPPFRYVQN